MRSHIRGALLAVVGWVWQKNEETTGSGFEEESVREIAMRIVSSNLSDDLELWEFGFHSTTPIPLFFGNRKENLPLAVYPNPVTDKLFLENQTEERLGVELFDMSGKHLSSVKIADTEKVSLPVNAWQAGLYFLKINDGRQMHVQRFVKN